MKILTMLVTIAALTFVSSHTYAATKAEKQIKQCQKWKDKIKKYDELRRKGGKAKDMDKWYRAREDLQAKFSDKNCRRWRHQLE
ncbi:hypothetical protein [Sansalvadorimonas verongulae]|uniref:hypothetical protein n=1 Tax=Sansalvadorimonas verongulae TaxID=2172824 RepID=UPI0012BC2E10|nr:hypothetical protein [Sansalvadorimonas verongulae]MTI14555.1 hypothetical protein [Sansalvadorimonas verongulae]